MGTVKLAAALPKEPEQNGLMDHARAMLAAPKDEVIFIVRASVKAVHDDYWDGTRVPELGILAVEMPVGEEAEAAKRIMAREKDRRYARRRLPWEEPGTLGEELLKRGRGVVTGRVRTFDVDTETGDVTPADDDADPDGGQ